MDIESRSGGDFVSGEAVQHREVLPARIHPKKGFRLVDILSVLFRNVDEKVGFYDYNGGSKTRCAESPLRTIDVDLLRPQ